MRLHTVATAFVLGMQTWAAAQDPSKGAKPPLGTEAYKLLTSFYDYDRDTPLEARIVGKFERPEAAFDKIVFRSLDSQVVAYLAIPKLDSPPYPCVLALHGLGLDKMSWWEDDNDVSGGNLTKTLLRAGIAVLTPDAQYHGERTHSNGYEFTVPLGLQKGREFRFRGMLIQSIVDCRRAIDYLETRSDIDESRIGVLGYSLGAMETFALTALDTRVKVAVACVPPIGHLDRMGFSPSILPQTFAHELKDRPFLMLMGRQDPFSTEAEARRIHELIPASNKKLMFFDSGHVLPVEYVSHAAKWLQDGLQ